MQITLSWEEPTTGERRSPNLNIPVALGREFAHMPSEFGDRRAARVVLNSLEVSRFHTLIDLEQGAVVVFDQNSSNGTFVNGQRQMRSNLSNGDTLQIGPYQITVTFAALPTQQLPVSGNSQIFFNPDTNIPDPRLNQPAPQPVPTGSSFPPSAFQALQVSVQDLHATGLPVDEIDYATVGAGLGSFVWVDLLRIYGVKSQQIAALGMEEQPYARYKRLCLNSQIPLQERLRSNSDSCPDNIWGWPSYALREVWHDFSKGQVNSKTFKYLWQVFSEPTFADTYTPRAGNVFDSIDRETARIGWQQMFRYARVRAIRQTADGRYAIAYSREGPHNYAFLIARNVHLATGYPAIQFLPDLQAYREQTQDFLSVVNAYEDHHHVYEHLERHGGTVLIRGRGIVASRIVQRIYEARQHNQNIALLHLMRSPKPQGNKFGKSQRLVENHYEFQPFNWPKATWGGELKAVLEKADPQKRPNLLTDWGGTTTADRGDWKKIVQAGINQGWYQINFGEVEKVERDPNNSSTVTYIQEKGMKGQMRLEADFIIDATGLDAKVKTNPLLDDLVTHYNLPLNHLGRLVVSDEFELVEMRNQKGRMYAAGATTLGNYYAPVDSFLGLQYAALRSVDSLASAKSPGLHRLNAVSSFGQWLKWVANQSPS
ncbi:Forkhead-associated protein [Crinalium epipsammum PCC 9333]|uniref:Forkhead-associated protein n=1 Tax=Crinalium epipsammum PCC 9333 TaxID=1173022 RepID=K9VVZ4_9CYAN|nr:FHA domain-containing protein [Crinalium epipsammum]AFZ11734.1 Forkhead-associated protein [Crinalium epipsammum PCC 9333]